MLILFLARETGETFISAEMLYSLSKHIKSTCDRQGLTPVLLDSNKDIQMAARRHPQHFSMDDGGVIVTYPIPDELYNKYKQQPELIEAIRSFALKANGG
jgi:hypothetical protein